MSTSQGEDVSASEECSDCPVCLEPIARHSACRTECGHVFHSSCAFRAVRSDPRCSICRTELVPVEEPTQNEAALHLRVAEVNLVEFSSHFRRIRQNYNARRRRAEARCTRLQAARECCKRAEREVVESAERYDKAYGDALRRLKDDLTLRTQRRLCQRDANRERALRRRYDAMLEQVMGEKPPQTMEEFLVERFGGELEEYES